MDKIKKNKLIKKHLQGDLITIGLIPDWYVKQHEKMPVRTPNDNTTDLKTAKAKYAETPVRLLDIPGLATDIRWKELAELLWNLSKDKHTIDVNKADLEAREKTPGFWTFTAPAWAGLAAILGFESAGALSAAAATYPEAFSSFLGSMLGGQAIDLATNIGSGGLYSSWGDYANQTWGHGDKSSDLEKFLWEASNVGYLVNPLSRGASAIEQNGKRFLDYTVKQLSGPWVLRALNAANKYNLGEGIKAGIYNTDLSLLYGPEVVAKAGLNHLKLGVLDLGWNLRNIVDPFRLRKLSNNRTGAYQTGELDLKLFKPSDRYYISRILNNRNSVRNYIDTTPKFSLNLVIDDLPYNVTLPYYKNSYDWKNASVSSSKGIITPENVLKFRSTLSFTPFNFRSLDTLEFTHNLNSGKYDLYLTSFELPYIGTDHRMYFNFPGSVTRTQNLRPAEVSPQVLELNSLLEGLGHVTGSLLTKQNPYATHTPGDIDIITTQDNLAEVLNKLGVYSPLNARNSSHIKVTSDKYGSIDIQIIQNHPNNPNMSAGPIAEEIFSKLNPDIYIQNRTLGIQEVPVSPDELLNLHQKNALLFSNIDLMVSNKDKHIFRTSNIYGSESEEAVLLGYNDMIKAYLTIFGNDFKTLEQQGININYSDYESNLLFLLKLGLNPDDAAYIAKSPLKTKLAAENFIYETHTAARTIERLPGMSEKDLIDALLTNASYSNYGGNWARDIFGGGKYYGGKNGYTGVILFPVRHADKIKTPIDLYNEVGRYIVVPPEEHPRLALQLRNDFRFTDDQIKYLKDLFKIKDYQGEITSLQDLIPFTVPNRGNFGTQIGPNDGNSAARLFYSDLNDLLAQYLDIDFIFSKQSGFNNHFLGKYRKNTPGATVKLIPLKNGLLGEEPKGFEFPIVTPRVPDILGAATHTNPKFGLLLLNFHKASENRRKIINKKRAKASKIETETSQIIQDKVESNYSTAMNNRLRVGLGGVSGLLGAAVYSMYDNSPRTIAVRISNEVPSNIYNSSSELIKFLKDKYNIILEDYEIKDIVNQKGYTKQKLTLSKYLDTYIRYKDR